MTTRPTSAFALRAESLTAVVPGLGELYAEGSGVLATISGTLAVTLDDVAIAATASEFIHGSLALTLDAVTIAGTGIVQEHGVLAVTLDAVTLAAAGTVRGGILNVTLANIRLNATGTRHSYSPIVRKQNWPTILANMIADAYCEPFAWGTHDCCIWSADVIMAMSETSVDLGASYRSTYHDEAGANAIISAATGGGDLEDLIVQITTAYGFDEISPNQAQRGDLVLADTSTGPGAGIIGPDGREGFFVAPDGLVLIGLSDIRRAWRI
jgi:hypothetical protein